MNETNELQPTPEVEVAEAQVTSAPAEETPEEMTVSEETTSEENASEENASEETQTVENNTVYETKEQVVDRLKAIQEENTGGDKNELDLLKQVFYKLHLSLIHI